MKVLMVAPEFPPYSLGGGGLVVQTLACELHGAGVDVKVLSGFYRVEGNFDKPFMTKSDGNEIIWFPLIKAPKVKFQLNTITPPNVYSFAEALRIFVMEDFDIVHIHGYGHFFCDLFGILCRLRRKPFVYTIHGFPKEPQRKGGALKVFYQFYTALIGTHMIRAAAKIIPVSKSLAKECLTYTSPGRIEVIYNGLGSFDYGKPSDKVLGQVREKYSLEGKTVILGIGRFSVAKGFQYAIAAMPLVLRAIPNAMLVLVGRDDGYGYSVELARLRAEHKVDANVVCLETVSDFEKVALLWQAGVVVIPSIEEVFGLVALEAMSTGRQIVANKIGGLVEVLKDDKYSSLLDTADVDRLAAAIIEKLRDKQGAEDAVKESSLRIRKFSAEAMAINYLNTYQDVLENPKKR